MAHAYGEGNLGQIVYGSRRYQIIWDDLLWAGRMIIGEAGSDLEDAANVLWCMTQKLAERSSTSFVRVIRNYSQPINPNWYRSGQFCMPGGRNFGEDGCSERALANRDRILNTSWEQLPSNVQDLVYNWATGRLDNRIAKGSEFAVPAVASHHNGAAGLAARQLQIVYDKRNRGPDSIDKRGNVFYSTERTRSWGNNFVTVQYQERQTQEATPFPTTTTTTSTTASTTTILTEPSGTFDRTEAMTSGRTEPPHSDYHYFTLSSSLQDPSSNNILSEQDEQILARTNYDRFYDQILHLKSSETLDFAKSLPTIIIWGEDEVGNIVNLTEEIFSKSPFHNYFEDAQDFNADSQAEFPDRPLASVVSLTVDVQSPSVGGTTAISILNLKIKIHNPSLVTTSHPKGKFISYMMRPGYNLRIRYGVTREEDADIKAFQWKEQGFTTAQYQMVANDDKTIELTLTMLPNTQKLMNQVLIGESIPIGQLNQITNEDINQVLNSITSGGDTLTQQQIDEIQNRIRAFQNTFNRTVQVAALRTQITGQDTFGSTLHGAIQTTDIFRRDGLDATTVVVDNTVEALRSLQSLLLTRRFESVMTRDAYQYVLPNGSPIPAINCGPLVFNLVRPEIEMIVQYAANNNMQIGEIFSDDASLIEDNSRRNNVEFIFGNFNSQAGQWASKPISSFPVNLESIFSYLRERRLLGQFSNNLNGFMNNVASIINDSSNYSPERTGQRSSDGTETVEPNIRVELPQIKFLLYPDPRKDRSDNWIFYVYDNKQEIVEFRSFLEGLNSGEIATKEQIIEACIARKVPWIEMGTNGNFIKSLSANTQGDDMVQSHNMIMANRAAMGQRHADASPAPSSVFSDWWDSGATASSQRREAVTGQIQYIPFACRATSFILTSAVLFSHVYIFFPVIEFSGIFTIQSMGHTIQNGQAITNLDLNYQASRAPRRATA